MTSLTITHERIDDIPVLLALMENMKIKEKIDQQIKAHGHWQGISIGHVVVIWLCYILTEHDHRLVKVREWVKEREELFNRWLKLTLRETDLTDDRLAQVLSKLGEEEIQVQLDSHLVQEWMSLYELPQEITRHDSTTVAVYQDVEEEKELIGYGHSKDHRPDLAQFKVMVATLDPLGLPLSCQVVNGRKADTGLYIPSYESAVSTLGHKRFLAVGDGKMGSHKNRAYLTQQGSYYLTVGQEPSLPKSEKERWIEQALSNVKQWQEVTQVNEQTGEIELIAELYVSQRNQQAYTEDGQPLFWTERVLVARSKAYQEGLAQRRQNGFIKLSQELDKLRLPPQKGRKRYQNQEELRQEVERLLHKYHLTEVVQVSYLQQTLPSGGQRWIVDQYLFDPQAWIAYKARLGWQIYLTTAPSAQYDAATLLKAYRHQPILERGLARLKSRNLHIRPIFLHDEQRICGLTWLLFLALRVLVLLEFRVRRQLARQKEVLVGLDPAFKSQTTALPTAERLLKAFGNITFSIIRQADQVYVHISPLTNLQKQILALLDLPLDVYFCLEGTQPSFYLRE